MKKLSLIFLVAMSLVASSVNAQNEDYKDVVSVTAGYSLFNLLAKAANTSSTGGSIATGTTASSTPTLQLSYDHGFGKVFSLGGAVSYNSGKVVANDYEWIDANGKSSIGNYTINLSRITVAARTLFHYGNSGKLDMYSGFRVGVGIWNTSATSSNPDFDPEDEFSRLKNGVILNAQAIPFGLRYYFTDNLGAGFETAFGGPYLASFSLQYRLGGSGRK